MLFALNLHDFECLMHMMQIIYSEIYQLTKFSGCSSGQRDENDFEEAEFSLMLFSNEVCALRQSYALFLHDYLHL
jgi:hypothetical protein